MLPQNVLLKIDIFSLLCFLSNDSLMISFENKLTMLNPMTNGSGENTPFIFLYLMDEQ